MDFDASVSYPGNVASPAAPILAHCLAVAVHHARAHGEERRRRERLELLSRVGQIVSAGLELPEVLARAAESIRELLGYASAAIVLADPDEGPEGAGRQVHVVRAGWPAGRRAELAVPLTWGAQALGTLSVEGEGGVGEEDAQSLRIVAGHLAIAIRNAWLHERARRAAARAAAAEERQRLSRDLHDSVTQQLVGIVLIAQSIAPAWRRGPRQGAHQAARLVGTARAALAEMRELVARLRPGQPEPAASPLRHEGLGDALRRHAARVSASPPAVEVELDEARLAPEHEEALYRIGQESISNAVKHGRASRVHVRVGAASGAVRLRVGDDGRGFDVEQALADARPGGRREGLGLLGMRERVAALGGQLRIASRRGAGTTVEVTLPLRRTS